MGSIRDILGQKLDNSEKLEELELFSESSSEFISSSQFIEIVDKTFREIESSEDELFAIFYLGLDYSIELNDTDNSGLLELLDDVVLEKLSSVLRANDELAKFGNSEFAILLRDVRDVDSVAKVAERIQNALTKPISIARTQYSATASIGITLNESDTESDTESETKSGLDLLNRAIHSMKSAKEMGEARHVIHNAKTGLEKELSEAVSEGQLDLHYQPIISLNTGRIVGSEALIRWNHPVKGLIPPVDLIYAAEETGLILYIGEWVLKTACTQNKIWQMNINPDLRIGVNFSVRQFQRKNFTEMVKNVLDETGMSPSTLDMEITENAAIGDIERTNEILESVRELGVRISIDDFGTGYCSMEYLKSLPVDNLKIDRTFISDISDTKENRNDLEIIRAVISMAHSMSLNVIAEGVETYDQLQFLISNQCDEVQGYLFSKPIESNSFNEIISKKTNFGAPFLNKAKENLRDQYVGELLVQAGQIKEINLEHALNVQQRFKEKVGQLLLRQGIVDEDTLLNTLAFQSGNESINLYKQEVDPESVKLISKDIAMRYRVLPVGFADENGTRKLIVAMNNPSDLEALDTLEFATGYKIEPLFTLDEHLYWLIRYYYYGE